MYRQNPSRYWAGSLGPIFHSPDIPIGLSVHESSPQLHSTHHHDVLGSADSIEVNQFCILQFQKDFNQYEVCDTTRIIEHGILRLGTRTNYRSSCRTKNLVRIVCDEAIEENLLYICFVERDPGICFRQCATDPSPSFWASLHSQSCDRMHYS